MSRQKLILAASAAALAFSGPAQAQVRWNFEYAVKVVCGNVDDVRERPLAVGRYYTAVNIHNPGGAIYYRNKVAIAAPGRPGPISLWEQHGLANDEAIELDCSQISRQAKADWVKGFLVIQSTQELDIVAVYTTSGNGPYVSTFHTERVPPRRIS